MTDQLPKTRPFKDLTYANGITPLKANSADGKVYTTCGRCDTTYMAIVAIADYTSWTTGVRLAHEAFPYLTRDKLTLLESGLCLECFDKLWTEPIHNNSDEALVYPDADDDHAVG